MTLAVLLLLAPVALLADWSAVEALKPGTRVQVAMAKSSVRGTLIRANRDTIAVAAKTGEVSVPRAEVKRVSVAAPEKRTRHGLLGVGIGAAGGLGAGVAICPYCGNEGHSGFGAIGAAIGAGIGALAFLPMPCATVYRAPKR